MGQIMDKMYKLLWSLSLFIIATVTVIWTVCSMKGIELADAAIRIMGVLDICAIPALIYTSIKMRKR